MKPWVIRKGWHYSLSNLLARFKIHKGVAPISVNFNLSDTCWFPYKDTDDNDINKLFGYSFGWHHKNSIRVGWVPNFTKKDKICLYFYNYNNGQRTMEAFADVWCCLDYTIVISVDEKGKSCVFDLYRKGSLEKERSVTFTVPKKKLGYYLWPYFGGNKTAPTKMVFKLDVG